MRPAFLPSASHVPSHWSHLCSSDSILFRTPMPAAARTLPLTPVTSTASAAPNTVLAGTHKGISKGRSVVEAVTLSSPSHSNMQYSPSFQSRFGPRLFSSQTCILGHVTPSKSPTVAPSACSPRHHISSFSLASGPYVGTHPLARMSWSPESSCHVRYTSSQVLS